MMLDTVDPVSSPFLCRGECAEADSLAVLHLRRDHQVPLLLSTQDQSDQGYEEGKVTNTRFGSFPHSTLIGVKWGSQVRASAVDTGSRGHKSASKKRKRDEITTLDVPNLEGSNQKEAVVASTGFAHLLPPTPESWTTSLPHRTQVVYTSDYSYILQRLRVKPGSVVIEAGAGSGSFTHAAARAAYGPNGKVWSYEFHEQRVEKLKVELRDHGLDGIVEINHRDVCEEGFLVGNVRANAIFLDLPAPWLALKHLTRQGPLDPLSTVHICTFSPCIEQVQRTVTEMREYGWLEIEMVEIAAKKIEVRRERVGLQEEGLRGVNASAASVDEALARLRENERRTELARSDGVVTKEQRLTNIREALPGRKLFSEGRLSHRPEPELKTHTSYLVFALMPRTWTAEDEAKAQEAVVEMQQHMQDQRNIEKEANHTAGSLDD